MLRAQQVFDCPVDVCINHGTSNPAEFVKDQLEIKRSRPAHSIHDMPPHCFVQIHFMRGGKSLQQPICRLTVESAQCREAKIVNRIRDIQPCRYCVESDRASQHPPNARILLAQPAHPVKKLAHSCALRRFVMVQQLQHEYGEFVDLNQPTAFEFRQRVCQFFAQARPGRVSLAELKREAAAAHLLDPMHRLTQPAILDLVPEPVANIIVQDRSIKALDEAQFVCAVRDVHKGSGEALRSCTFRHLLHERSLPHAPRRQQEKVIGIEITPTLRHLACAVKEIVTLGYSSRDIPHTAIYKINFVQQFCCTTES